MNLIGDKSWIFYILPGFVSLLIVFQISDSSDIREFDIPIYYVALTVLSLIIPAATFHFYGLTRAISYTPEELLKKPVFLMLTFLFSIGWGVVVGASTNTDFVPSMLRGVFGADLVSVESHRDTLPRLLLIVQSTGFPDKRQFFKSDTEKYTRFSVPGADRTYEGLPREISAGDGKMQVYLTPACEEVAGKLRPVRGPGVWANLNNVTDIQFLDARCSACAILLELEAGRTIGHDCPYAGTMNSGRLIQKFE